MKKIKQTELPLETMEPEITKGYMLIDGNSILSRIKNSLNFLEKISIMEYIPKWSMIAKYAQQKALTTLGKKVVWNRYYFEVGEKAKLEIFHKNLNDKFHKEFRAILIHPTESISEEACAKIAEDKIRESLQHIATKGNSHVILVSDNKTLVDDLWQIRTTPNRHGTIVFCGYLNGDREMYNLEGRYGVEGWDIVDRCHAARELPMFRPISAETFDPREFL